MIYCLLAKTVDAKDFPRYLISKEFFRDFEFFTGLMQLTL